MSFVSVESGSFTLVWYFMLWFGMVEVVSSKNNNSTVSQSFCSSLMFVSSCGALVVVCLFLEVLVLSQFIFGSFGLFLLAPRLLAADRKEEELRITVTVNLCLSTCLI